MRIRKRHKKECNELLQLGDLLAPVLILQKRLHRDPKLLKNIHKLAISLLDLHLYPSAYKTHYVRLLWRVTPTSPDVGEMHLERYGVLPLSSATPGLLKDANDAQAGGVAALIIELIISGSETWPDGPYSLTFGPPLPPTNVVKVRYVTTLPLL